MSFDGIASLLCIVAVIALALEVHKLKRRKPVLRAPLCGSEITWQLLKAGWTPWEQEKVIQRFKDAK